MAVIVAQNTNSQWFKVLTELGPVAFFQGLLDEEAADRAAGRSTWVPVEPLAGYTAFGPALQTGRLRLEHVALFGITED